jgi:PAS domain S-box-containing protein
MPPAGRIEPIGDSQTFLEYLLASSTEYSIVAMDLQARIILWNEGARRIYGYVEEDVIGKDVRMLHSLEDVGSGKADAIVQATLSQGKWEGIVNRRRKNGEEFPARVVMTVIRDKHAVPLGMLLVSKDITAEELLHRKLIESEEYNRGLIESNVDALMLTDTLGVITDVNRRVEELTGVPREALVGTPLRRYFADPARADEAIRRVLVEDRLTNFELALRSVSGSASVVALNATTFRSADGKLRGVFAAARDVTEQKTLEAQLRQSQNYTRGLIEASLDVISTVDRSGNISDVNRQMETATGYSREELLGSRFADYFTDPERAAEGLRLTFEVGYLRNYDLVLRARTGMDQVVSLNASVVRDARGEVQGVLASARDITEQRLLDSQLQASQNYNRSLIEASPDALFVVDPELVITDVNEEMVRLTGYARQELIGSSFKSYFTDPVRAASGVRGTLELGSLDNYELVLKPRTGAQRVVSLNASVFRDPEGHNNGVFASARDITDQRALEEQLRESENYNRGLIEASVDAMVIVDPRLLITDVNEQMVKLTGHSRKQLTGSAFIQYFTEPDRAAAGVRQTLERGFATNYELILRSKNGTETPVSFNASVFKDVEGRVKGIFASARDVSEQRALNAQLQESQNYTRGLIESSVDALFTTDVLGVISDVNRQMEVMTESTREELIGSPLRDYFTDPGTADIAVRRVLEQNQLKNFELVLKSRSGIITPVSFNASTFRAADGSLRGIFAAARDVTEQKKLEGDLRETRNYNRTLIESSADALVTVDPSLTITDVNEQMVKITGYSRLELSGSLFPDYFTDPGRAASGVRQTLESGIVTNYELTLRNRHGRLIQVSFNASVFKDVEGNVRGIFAAARDITEQKRLQDQLRESQMYNRSLIEASPDALVMVDPELVITDVNEQLVKLTGTPRDALVGSSFKDYFTDPERATVGVRRTLREGSVANYELVLKSRAGRHTLVSFNAAVFRDIEGKVAGIFASARDITEQKKTEGKLREMQNYNRGLIEASPDALVTVDPDLFVTDVNEQMVRLTGFSRKRLIGSRFPELFTDPDRADRGVRTALRENLVSNYELLLKKRNGQKIPVSFNAGTFHDMAGSVRGVLAAARDISEQKRLEAQIRESQNYNRGLVESNIDGLMTTDLLGTITDVNKQMERLTGLSREQLIGTPFKNYFTDPPKAEEGIRRVLSDNRVTDFELTIRTPTGRTTTVSYNATTFQDTEGRLHGVIAAARDITGTKRLREQLEQRNAELEVQNRRVQEANRLKSEFLANMSHELRTPLNSIIGFSDFLLNEEETDPSRPPLTAAQREYLGDILNSGNHLLQLINDVLDLAKVESGKMELSPEVFSPRRALEEVCSVVKPLVAEKKITLATEVAAEFDTVLLDPLRFKQILYNLLSNAVKFTDEGGRVSVRVAPNGGGMFSVVVEDTGIGISPEDLHRLFREFEQLDIGPGRRYQGSGLGLSLTKKLVELHGGTVEVASELGHGSTFTVRLPFAAPAAAEERSPSPSVTA